MKTMTDVFIPFEKMTMNKKRLMGICKDYFYKNQTRPLFPIPRHVIDHATFLSQESLVWLGHSTVLGHLDNKTFIVDPVFSVRASPISCLGPKRFDGSLTPLSELPSIDFIFITHNHYDHLDRYSIMALHEQVQAIYVPDGNGALLSEWGICQSKIKEFKWFEEFFIENLMVCFCPTQHFSSRGLFDRDKTLWGSWVIKSKSHSLFVSGDSGYNEHFKVIAQKYAPFDIACIECGAYNENWKEIHMRPEESVQAAKDLQAKMMLPIHWGSFDLSTHVWNDPINRAIQKANELDIPLIIPMIGEVVSVQNPQFNNDWITLIH